MTSAAGVSAASTSTGVSATSPISVGCRVYARDGSFKDPSLAGHIPVVVMMKSHGKYYKLSPYELKDEQGRILENTWQNGKVYEKVPAVCITASRYSDRVIWQRGAETHVKIEAGDVDAADALRKRGAAALTAEYHQWRRDGMNAPDAIRYPVGFAARTKCLGAFADRDGELDGELLGYVVSRKRVYLPLYDRLAREHPLFAELLHLLELGRKLLIIEVDGPHYESLEHYRKSYGVVDTFITPNNTMAASYANLHVVLNDTRHPFGHGYALASALQNFTADLCADVAPADVAPADVDLSAQEWEELLGC